MNGTKASNMGNKNIGYSTTVDRYDVNWLFSKVNVLEGTTYNDLLKYIGKNEKVTIKKKRKFISRSMARRMSYHLDGREISGRNNRESLYNLVSHIGPNKLDNVLWPSIVSYKEREGFMKLGEGFYVNTRLSGRDTKTVIQTINQKLNINIEIKEE
jgi:hypothetical protein